MAAAFSIQTMGGHAIEAKLASLARAFGDLTPLMETFGGILETQTSERFEAETAPDGSRWKPSLRARQDGGKTLTDRTTLRGSIHSIPSRLSVEIGTNLVYAGVHQGGAKIRAKTSAGLRFQLPGGLGWRRVMEVEIPARPFLGLSTDNGEELLEEAEAYALDAMGGEA
ncbi:phage virion morphogenesis protein [Novosphingobium clariflavum]|uniref:Phage virion morphogenesis protein n=1 Tax=Novosphingobium clariflavum TaxID=2029884 RepID=A0ABV6SAZ0_9SPHN|nr:phage virion morphogenesis protein [Novosphingobium clariflavum]